MDTDTDNGLTVTQIAIVVIAVIATLGAAKIASDFLVPVVAGIMLAYALEPPVSRLAQYGLPRGVAAALVLFALVGATAGTAYWLRHDAAAVVAELPEAARKLRYAVRSNGPPGPLAHVQQAAQELEKAAAEAQGKAPVPKPDPAPPVAAEVSTRMAKYTATLVEVIGQMAIAATLALFLLAAGDAFRRKLLHIVGGPLSQRRVTVEILNEIDTQVQRYLLVMLITNIVLAVLCWFALMLVGMARPALWATVVGVLHFIPYVGGVMGAIVVAIAALVEGSVATAIYATLATLAIVLVVGMGFNTWLQGRACRMNAVSVFVSVLLFGWLWGGWGLLLGAPIAAIAKTIADRVEGLYAFGQLLGEVPQRAEPDAAPAEVTEKSIA